MAAIPQHTGYQVIYGAGTGPNGDRIDVWVEYTTTQDQPGNRTLVKAYFYTALHPGESSGTYDRQNGLVTTRFTVNGVSGTGLADDIPYDFQSTNNIHSLGTFNQYIPHNEDGTKTVSVSGAFTVTSSYITGGTLSASIVLPAIQRGLFRANVSGTWRSCIAYVNVSGTWRQALAYANVSGAWKQGI